MNDEAFAVQPPAFNSDEALLQLRRALREMGLAERNGVFERRGLAIARAVIDGDVLRCAVVRKPSRASPQWLARELKSSADVREFAQALKKQLAAWTDDD